MAPGLRRDAPDLATHIARLMTNSNSCTASFTQIAGVEAVRGDQASVDRMRAEFQQRRDVFVAGLNRIKGFSCRMPKGAFTPFQYHRNWLEFEEAFRGAAGTSRRGCFRELPLENSGKAICVSAWPIPSRKYPPGAGSHPAVGQKAEPVAGGVVTRQRRVAAYLVNRPTRFAFGAIAVLMLSRL